MEKGLNIKDLEKLLEESYKELSSLSKSKSKIKKTYKASEEEELEEKDKDKEKEKMKAKDQESSKHSEKQKEEEIIEDEDLKEEDSHKAEMSESNQQMDSDESEDMGEEEAEAEEFSDEELMQIYAAMTPEELDRHLKIAQAVASKMKGAAAKAPEQSPSAMEAQKAEKEFFNSLIKHLEGNDNEIQSLKNQIEELKKALHITTKAVLLQNKPIRKSVSGIDFIDRSGAPVELAKSQIDERLAAKINSPTLTPHERAAINRYYLTGEISETIKRLIS